MCYCMSCGCFFVPQAELHNVPTYIVGFVIGLAPLCVAVVSPLSGYFVSNLAVVSCSLVPRPSLQLSSLAVRITWWKAW